MPDNADALLARILAALTTAGVVALVADVPLICWLLAGAQAIDYLSGVLAAGTRGEINSSVGWTGVRKKALTWCVVAVVYLGQVALNSPAPLAQLVAGAFLGIEGLSVIENAGAGGVWIPGIVKRAFEQLRDAVGGEGRPPTSPPTVPVA